MNRIVGKAAVLALGTAACAPLAIAAVWAVDWALRLVNPMVVQVVKGLIR